MAVLKKILFINPIRMDMNFNIWCSPVLREITGGNKGVMPKLVGMILAALTPEDCDFKYVDEAVGERIDYEYDADLVVLTAMTVQAGRAYEVAGEFHKRGKIVVAGGIHTTILPEETGNYFDVLMMGECENTWPVMLDDFKNDRLKKIYNSKDYPPVEKLIGPKIDVINLDRYLLFPIQATRGCPHRCEFCSIQYSSGSYYRMKPVAQVVEEIKAYQEYNKVNTMMGKLSEKGYYFVDDNLYVNREYTKELLTALIPLKIRWEGQGTSNVAKDDEILQLLADSGCRSFYVGFESIVPESLQEMQKSHVNKVQEYKDVIHKIAEKGIIPAGDFVFGFDGDDVSVFKKSVEFMLNTELILASSAILTPYPGTKLYERIKDRIYDTFTEHYNSGACVFTPNKMTAEQLRNGLIWIYKNVTDVSFLKGQLKKYWRLGPWKNNPPLTMLERVALIAIGFKLGFIGMWGQTKFALWAAFNRKAVDFKMIVWMLRTYEIARRIPNLPDPA